MNSSNLASIKERISIVVTILFFVFMIWHDIIAVISMIKIPTGHTSVNFIVWRHSFHSITILAISVIFLVLYFYSFPDKDPLHRLSFSIVVSVFTVIFYECWWHLGCWMVTGYGNPLFWAMYDIVVAICIIYLHVKYEVLEFSVWRMGVFLPLFSIFLLGWFAVMSSGFYEAYLAFSLDHSPDPHTLLIMGDKVIGMFASLGVG